MLRGSVEQLTMELSGSETMDSRIPQIIAKIVKININQHENAFNRFF